MRKSDSRFQWCVCQMWWVVWVCLAAHVVAPTVVLPLTRKSGLTRRIPGSDDFALPAPNFSLSGCPTNDFTVDLAIGGQTLPVIVDTGSTTLGVALNTCMECFGLTAYYTPGASSFTTSNRVTAEYGDGSGWMGQVTVDDVGFPGTTPVQMSFAAIFAASTNPAFFTESTCELNPNGNVEYSGILGMAYSSLALSHTDSFIAKVANAQVYADNVFALMMCNRTGRLWMGGWDNSTFVTTNATMVQTSIVTQSYYEVATSSVAVGNNGPPLQGGAGDVIVDSGTTQILLEPALYNAVVSALVANASFVQTFGSNFFSRQTCIRPLHGNPTIQELNQMLPPLVITFAGTSVPLVLPAVSSYAVYSPDSTSLGKFCPGLMQVTGTGFSIFGWAFMNFFVCVFNVATSQIGFVPLASDACARMEFANSVPSNQNGSVYIWELGAFGPCDASSGYKMRNVTCVNASSGATAMNSSLCNPDSEPSSMSQCSMTGGSGGSGGESSSSSTGHSASSNATEPLRPARVTFLWLFVSLLVLFFANG